MGFPGGPLPTLGPDRTLPPGPHHDLTRALPQNRTQQGQKAPGLGGLHREKALWGLLCVRNRVNSVLVKSPSPSPQMVS